LIMKMRTEKAGGYGASKKLPQILERQEIAAIKRQPNTRCPTGLRNRAILEVMHRGGLRISEIINLRRRDIRWDICALEVRGGKGGKDRTVPLDNTALAWLRAWDAQRPRGKTFFTTLKGGILSARYLQQLVKRLACKAGIEDPNRVTPHVFRHTCATELLDEGFTIREVQAFLGHAWLNTTSIYLHVRPETLMAKTRARLNPDPGPKPLKVRARQNPSGPLGSQSSHQGK